MGKFVDLCGRRFGRLTVMEVDQSNTSRCTKWLCRCECGAIRSVRSQDLTRGTTLSCGCYHKDQITKHGMSTRFWRHPLYATWNGMITRCHNPKHHDYPNYGGRGISVCERWRDITNFIADMYGDWAPGLQLDRKDNNGDYCPENCRWVTCIENANNKRTTLYALGAPVSELSRISGINVATLRDRIHRGWPESDLLLPPSYSKRSKRDKQVQEV